MKAATYKQLLVPGQSWVSMRLGEPYRSQESQDVNLPDATALQVGDGGPLLLLVFGRHFGDGSTARLPLIVVRPRGCRPEISANCGFFGPVVTKARKETLAGKRCGETSGSVEIGQLGRLSLPKEIVPGGGGNARDSTSPCLYTYLLACTSSLVYKLPS